MPVPARQQPGKRVKDYFLWYDVLFTDIQLEENQSGWVLVNRVFAHNSAKKIIVTSGRFSKTIPIPGKSRGKISLVAKPYTRQELKALLRV